MPRIDALIFDLDGTLADSLADIAEAANLMLGRYGLPPHPLDTYRPFVGEGIERLVVRATRAAMGKDPEGPEDGLPAPVATMVAEYRQGYAALGHRSSEPYPGIEALLDAVTASRRPMAVLSNKRDEFTRELVAQRFGRWSFVDVRGERDGVPRKPDPTAALELALALRALPGRVGFVGDTAIDVATARNAGMVSIGVLWGFRSREELETAGAHVVVEAPAALARWLDAAR